MNDGEPMGKEQRAKQEQQRAAIEATLGPVHEFDHYRGRGCPKCNAPSAHFAKRWCAGSSPTTEGPCRVFGQHLHGQCGACGFVWREECADAERNREAMAKSLEPAPEVTNLDQSDDAVKQELQRQLIVEP